MDLLWTFAALPTLIFIHPGNPLILGLHWFIRHGMDKETYRLKLASVRSTKRSAPGEIRIFVLVQNLSHFRNRWSGKSICK